MFHSSGGKILRKKAKKKQQGISQMRLSGANKAYMNEKVVFSFVSKISLLHNRDKFSVAIHFSFS